MTEEPETYRLARLAYECHTAFLWGRMLHRNGAKMKSFYQIPESQRKAWIAVALTIKRALDGNLSIGKEKP